MQRTEVETVAVRRRPAVQAVAFYFDPICPWTWITSQWLREVQATEGVEVEWKFFSLALANNADMILTAPLRVLALVRRTNGNDAVERLYEAMGTVIHEGSENVTRRGALEVAISTALENAGFSRSLLEQALADESTLRDVEADYEEAAGEYGAYGSPWIVAAGQSIGFNGPILGRPRRGDEAAEMWEHVSWLISQDDFFELKREHE